MCYKWVLTEDLSYNNDVKKVTCSDCKKEKDKGICSVCNNPIYLQHAHTIEDGVLVCYSCYIDKVQDNNLDDMETCSECNKKVSNLFGKHYGELFTCDDCIKMFQEEETGITKYDKTEICDNCYNTIKTSKGRYTHEFIKIGRATVSRFICNKCYKKKD